MNFGEAIEALKQGKRVTRKGWNGKNMYLWLLPAATVKSEWCRDPFLKEIADNNGGETECLGAIRMKTADNKVLTGWLANQTDMLSEDWELYSEKSHVKDVDDWNYKGIRFLRADVGPIGWDSGTVNGVDDDDDNPQIPCVVESKNEKRWNILIDIKTGQVVNWTKGVSASVYYKVCDDGIYTAYDNYMNIVHELEDYVPSIMAFDDECYGYGDYVVLDINENGNIVNWPDNKKIKSFIDDFLNPDKDY